MTPASLKRSGPSTKPGAVHLETQTKLLTHAIRIAAFNTATTLARQLRLHPSYARANDEAHTLIRQALTGTGDIDPNIDGVLTIRLDPLPTRRRGHRHQRTVRAPHRHPDPLPGTNLILRYQIKNAP